MYPIKITGVVVSIRWFGTTALHKGTERWKPHLLVPLSLFKVYNTPNRKKRLIVHLSKILFAGSSYRQCSTMQTNQRESKNLTMPRPKMSRLLAAEVAHMYN